MTGLVDRPREDVCGQDDGDADREQAEEQLGKLDRATTALHARDDESRR